MACDSFKFEKRSQLLIRTHNETLPVITVRIGNEGRSPSRIDRCQRSPNSNRLC
jgi:hypothetical protein